MIRFSDSYGQYVRRYSEAGDEAVLIGLDALAARAVAEELPLEEIADIHHHALASLGFFNGQGVVADRTATCLSEFLMAFGLAYRERAQRMLDLQQLDAKRQKMEALGQMTAGVAHEFNNLLQPITGLAELALAEPHDDNTRHTLTTILDSARKAATIVRHLLTSVRQMTPEAIAVPFVRTIGDEIAFLRRTLPPSITLDARFPDHESTFQGHAGELGQIVQNLVLNAVDAMDGVGTIHVDVAAAPNDATLRFSVRDSGCGMAPAIAARIFDPFFSTKNPGHGTGLGLSVVMGIVNAWQGDIAVETALGQGTTITITLPSSHTARRSIS